MRHESERVPGKNYRLVAGRPLYAYILESLLQCPEIGGVVVDTDSPVIREGVATSYPSVVLLERPEYLRAGEIPVNVILQHDMETVPAELYLQTHSTNPLLRPQTISRAINEFREDREHDSLFSVTPFQDRLWFPDARPVNHDPRHLLRTQDLPALYLENSCLYLFRQETFLKNLNRIGTAPRLFLIGPEEAWDVDEEVDLLVVETLLRKRAGG